MLCVPRPVAVSLSVFELGYRVSADGKITDLAYLKPPARNDMRTGYTKNNGHNCILIEIGEMATGPPSGDARKDTLQSYIRRENGQRLTGPEFRSFDVDIN